MWAKLLPNQDVILQIRFWNGSANIASLTLHDYGVSGMDQKQRAAAYRLLAAIEANEITKEDAIAHGNWYSYLLEHLQADEQECDEWSWIVICWSY